MTLFCKEKRKLDNKSGIIPVVFLNIYLIMYAMDVYDIRLPIDPSQIRMVIVLMGFVYAIVKLVIRPKITYFEAIALVYSMVVVFGQFVNNLLSFSKAASDLFFPLVLFVFSRLYFDRNDDKIRKTIICENVFLIVFFALFLYASFSMKLQYGMYLNSCYYCALLLPFALSIRKPSLRNVLMMVCLIPSILALKRGAYLSVTMGILLYFFATRKTEEFRRNKNKYTMWAIVTLGCVVLVMVYMNQYMRLNIIERLLASSDDGGSGRTDLYKGMISLLQTNGIKGLLIGHGSFTSSTYLGHSSHNDFLEMLWSYGLLGFIPYVCMIWHFCVTSRRLRQQNSDFYPPCLVALVEFIICSFVSQLVFVPSYVAFLLLLFSMAEASLKNTKKIDLRIQ